MKKRWFCMMAGAAAGIAVLSGLGITACDTGNTPPPPPPPEDFALAGKYVYDTNQNEALLIEFSANGKFADGWGEVTGTWTADGSEICISSSFNDGSTIKNNYFTATKENDTITLAGTTKKAAYTIPKGSFLTCLGIDGNKITLYPYRAPSVDLSGTYTFRYDYEERIGVKDSVTFLPNGTYSNTVSYDPSRTDPKFIKREGKWILAGNLLNVKAINIYDATLIALLNTHTVSPSGNTVVLTYKTGNEKNRIFLPVMASPLVLTVKTSGEGEEEEADYELSGIYTYTGDSDNTCSLDFKANGTFDFTNTGVPSANKSGSWTVTGNDITLAISSPVAVEETFTITDTATTVTFTLKDDKAMSNILQMLSLANKKVLTMQKPAS
jgi:hypothetical protein